MAARPLFVQAHWAYVMNRMPGSNNVTLNKIRGGRAACVLCRLRFVNLECNLETLLQKKQREQMTSQTLTNPNLCIRACAFHLICEQGGRGLGLMQYGFRFNLAGCYVAS